MERPDRVVSRLSPPNPRVGKAFLDSSDGQDSLSPFSPYAWPETGRFFEAAIREGALHRMFESVEGPGGEQKILLKRCLLVNLYFSTYLVEEELGLIFGYGASSRSLSPNRREGPRKQIHAFIKTLWENCTDATRSRFPLEKIRCDKPLPEESRVRKSIGVSMGRNGTLIIVLNAFADGYRKPTEIARESGLSPSQAKATLHYARKKGLL